MAHRQDRRVTHDIRHRRDRATLHNEDGLREEGNLMANNIKLPGLHIRWANFRDRPSILDIENWSFEFPWPEEEFVQVLRQRNAIAMVAEWHGKVIGFVVYELFKHKLHVLNFAVDPTFRKQGVGRALFEKLTAKLTPNSRRRIDLEVRESNLDAQIFFRAIGCRCITTLRNFYDDTTEDAYVFQYRYKSLVAGLNTQSSDELAG